jgi:hypothetical protein
LAAERTLSKRELGAALGAGAIFAILALALFGQRMPGDGSGLVNALARADANGGPFTIWYHIGYAWLVSSVRELTPFLAARGTLEWVSAGAAGAAVTLAYLTCRRLDIGPKAAGISAALLALTPAMAEHATTIEVHTVQLAAGLFGLLTMAHAARASLKRLFGLSLTAGLVVAFAHQTGPLLFPGLVLASFWSDEDERPRPSMSALARRFLTSAVAFTLALLAAREATARFSPFAKIRELADFTSLTAFLAKGFSLDFLYDELLLGLPVLLAILVLGLALGIWRERRGKLALALVVVPYAFFLGFGERTSGGYFLGSAPGLILVVALTIERAFAAMQSEERPRLVLPVLLLATCGLCASPVFSFLWITNPERSEAESLARARLADVHHFLADGGTVFSLAYNELTLNGLGEDLREVSRCGQLRKGVELGYTHDVVRLGMQQALHNAFADDPRLLVDWTWTHDPLYFTTDYEPYLDVIRTDLDRKWRVEELHGDYGTFLRLTPKTHE